ncbi:MAG: dipeptidase, partial [bacterium]
IKNWEINLFASHSNVKKICNHPRNLDDKQLRAIKKVNGLIGINFYPSFLNKNLQVDINSVVKHIDYIKELIGVDYVALGTDFDGIEDTPYGLENLGQLNNLENALRKRGYNEVEIKKVFYLNAIRYFENSWR